MYVFHRVSAVHWLMSRALAYCPVLKALPAPSNHTPFHLVAWNRRTGEQVLVLAPLSGAAQQLSAAVWWTSYQTRLIEISDRAALVIRGQPSLLALVDADTAAVKLCSRWDLFSVATHCRSLPRPGCV